MAQLQRDRKSPEQVQVVNGRISREIYAHDDFRIFEVLTSNGERITAKGNIAGQFKTLGADVELTGEWREDSSRGPQFHFARLEVKITNIGTFFDRFIPGVSFALAQKIENRFGDNSLKILDEAPERLMEVKGISKKKYHAIISVWQEVRVYAKLAELLGVHIGTKMLVKVYNHFGPDCVDRINEDPYLLADVKGIGFRTSDEIALDLGTEPDDPQRMRRAIEYVLEHVATNHGDTRVPASRVISRAKKELDHPAIGYTVQPAQLKVAIDEMLTDGSLFCLDGGIIARRFYIVERNILAGLQYRLGLSTQPIMPEGEAERFITSSEKIVGFPYVAAQREAIRLVAAGIKTLIISGHAGTGKTSVCRAILQMLTTGFDHNDIVCCALAGKAADRARQVTGFNASTIHSLLGWRDEGGFSFDKSNRLPNKVVLLDEASMVPSSLFLSLLEALDDDAIFIIVGDDGQISAVGEGSTFEDILAARILPTVQLTEILRIAADSTLAFLANDIRQGRVPENSRSKELVDFEFVPIDIPDYMTIKRRLPVRELEALRAENEQAILAELVRRIKKAAETISFFDFQVLSPMRRGTLGITNLNRELQAALNPHKGADRLQRADVFWFPGDKVVHTKNGSMNVVTLSDYEYGGWDDEKAKTEKILNGMVGLIREVSPDDNVVYVEYPNYGGVVVRYYLRELGDILFHAYALSTHKSQGSEYPLVFAVVVNSHYKMLDSRWMYTTITRTQERCEVFGQSYTWEWACRQVNTAKRLTALQAILAVGLEQIPAPGEWRRPAKRILKVEVNDIGLCEGVLPGL